MTKPDQSSAPKTSIGRPSSMESEKLGQRIIDAILSLWIHPEDELSFSYIHKGLVRKSIVPNIEYRYKTVRILKKLCRMRLITKVARGRYRLNVEPDEFRIFDYLQTLRQRSEVSQFRIGGSLWSLCELHFLGMPESITEFADAKYALEILSIRIANLFEAIRILASEMMYIDKARKASRRNNLLILPRQVVRELLLELIPYYLGCRAGIDADGLPLDELKVVLPKMIQSLPEEVTYQSPTRKKTILGNLSLISKIAKASNSDWEKIDEEFYKERIKDFALIVTRPEYLIDEDGYEKRWAKDELVEYGLKGKSSIYIASSFLRFNKENVLAVLDVYGRKYVGKKCKETKELYEKLHAANQIGRIISSFDLYNGEVKADAMKFIDELTDKHGVKSMIKYLPFSLCSLNFILPTPEKENTLQKFFPQVKKEVIHEWLTEGAGVASKICDEKLDDLQDRMKTLAHAKKTRQK